MTRPQPAPADAGECVGARVAAAILDVDERTIRRWAEAGVLPTAYRTRGGHRRFRVADIDRLVDGGQDR